MNRVLLKSFIPTTFYDPDDNADDVADGVSILEDFDEVDKELNPDDEEIKEDEENELDEDKDDDKKDDKLTDDKKKKDDVEDKTDDKKEKKDDKADDKETVEPKELSIQALKESYPKILKEYPELKEAIFRVREYDKAFGSIEEANEAKEKADMLDQIAGTTLQGDPTELIRALQDTGKESLKDFAINFLPALQESNKEAYYAVTDRVTAHILSSAKAFADKRGDKNLGLAVKYISQFVFNEDDVPNLDTGRKELTPEQQEIISERNKIHTQRIQENEQVIHDFSRKKLTELIQTGLDPDNTYNDFVKEALTDKIIARVGATLVKDKAFQGQMAALWKRAARNGFDKDSKNLIVKTYLAKARRVMPSIRANVRGEAPNLENGKKIERKREINTSSNRGRTHSSIPNDPKKINWNETSDEDILASD